MGANSVQPDTNIPPVCQVEATEQEHRVENSFSGLHDGPGMRMLVIVQVLQSYQKAGEGDDGNGGAEERAAGMGVMATRVETNKLNKGTYSTLAVFFLAPISPDSSSPPSSSSPSVVVVALGNSQSFHNSAAHISTLLQKSVE